MLSSEVEDYGQDFIRLRVCLFPGVGGLGDRSEGSSNNLPLYDCGGILTKDKPMCTMDRVGVSHDFF